jgi:hypothetical protein
MAGDADYPALSAFGATGASVPLANIYSVEPDALGDPSFLITFRAPLEGDGANAMTLVTANKEIASGWSDAIKGQAAAAASVVAPPRTKAPVGPSMEDMAREAATRAAVATLKSMKSLAADAKRGGLSGFVGGLTSLMAPAKAEPVRSDAEYVVACPWDERGIDLQSKAGKVCLEDELGHPAAIMHGWLTKKNKSGIRAGTGEKERYFVLTPQFLSFFPDDRSAAVKDGYLYGKAVGERIGGLFEKTGARLPLEAVCEVKLLARVEDSRILKRMSSGSGGSLDRGRRRTGTGSDDDDDDGDASPAKGRAAAGGGKPKGKPKKGSDEEDEEDEEEEDAGAKAKAKKKAAAAAKAKAKKKKGSDDDDDDAESDGSDDSDDAGAKEKAKKKAAAAKAKAKKAGDDDDDDDDDGGGKAAAKPKPKGDRPTKPAGPKPTGAPPGTAPKVPSDKPAGARPLSSGPPSAGAGPGAAPPKPDGPAPSNLIEIDFGEYSLIINAHNQKNRSAWATALRKWSGWRKRAVDEEMLANMGMG